MKLDTNLILDASNHYSNTNNLSDSDKAKIWDNPNFKSIRQIGFNLSFINGAQGYAGYYYGTPIAYYGTNSLGMMLLWLRQWSVILRVIVGWGGGISIQRINMN